MRSILVVGKESVGKSQLLASLTGQSAAAANFRGTTIAVERYRDGDCCYYDTPGILRNSDSATTRLTLQQLEGHDTVLVVAKATHLDEDLDDLLPLLKGKKGAVAVTFWDRLKGYKDTRQTLAKLEDEARVPLIPLDARSLDPSATERLHSALGRPTQFPSTPLLQRAGWRIEPAKSWFEVPALGQLLALTLLLLPAWLAVQGAIRFADFLYDPLSALLAAPLSAAARMPAPLSNILGSDYGLIAMGPFLVLYAFPTVFAFAAILGAYKASGLIDRLTVAIDPLTRPIGLTARDLVRVIMGFGCNVPAVINSRACSSCSRGACVSAISFGAACSYQLPASIAVFAAAGMPNLVVPYLLLLAVTTAIYLRLTVPKEARLATNRLMLVGREFMQWPTASALWREMWQVLHQFFRLALPVFFVICIVAALMQWAGIIAWLASATSGLTAILRLPEEASTALILGSIRKDGIAIGLLATDWQTLKVPLASPSQVLTIVYLAGVLLPCQVTLFTVIREMSFRFAWRMAARQAVMATLFALIIAWGGFLLF